MSQTQVVYGKQGQQQKGNNKPQNAEIQANGIAKVEDGTNKVDDLVPICAHCCTITSFYCPEKMSSMCGCFGQGEILCWQTDFTCCKVAETTDACCIVQKLRCIVIKPVVCVQLTSQVFCCDHRCALPCAADVPCLFNIAGLTCFYDYKFTCDCCKSIGAMKPPPPPQQPNRF